jgi:hypothetical protein
LNVWSFCLGGLVYNPPVYASQVARMTGMWHHTQLFIGWDGVSLNFSWCCPWSVTLWSNSWVAGITGVSHCTWLRLIIK